MDWTIVALAALGVAGTLAGIWLGHWLDQRHRNDEEKRRIYAAYVSLQRRAIEGMSSQAPLVDVETLQREALDLFTQLHLLGEGRVVEAAAKVSAAVSEWLPGRGQDGDEQRKRAVNLAMADLVVAVRRDLGSGKL